MSINRSKALRNASMRKGSETVPLVAHSSVQIPKATPQKILELQQKHKELRRLRRETKTQFEIQQRDPEIFDSDIAYLFNKEQLI